MRLHLPALSRHFHLKPWDIEQMTLGEIRVYLDALEAIQTRRKR